MVKSRGFKSTFIRLQGSSLFGTVNNSTDNIFPYSFPLSGKPPVESKNLLKNQMYFGKPRHFGSRTAASHHFMKQHISIFSEFDVSSTRNKPVQWAEMNRM